MEVNEISCLQKINDPKIFVSSCVQVVTEIKIL